MPTLNGEGESAMDDEVKFHTDRVMAELDLAARSPDAAAADAHLRISALHLERMRALVGRPLSPGFRF